jgi:hypothetical protein
MSRRKEIDFVRSRALRLLAVLLLFHSEQARSLNERIAGDNKRRWQYVDKARDDG